MTIEILSLKNTTQVHPSTNNGGASRGVQHASQIPPLSRMIALAQHTSAKLREMAGKVAIFHEFLIISHTIVIAAYAPNLALDSQSQIVLAELRGGI